MYDASPLFTGQITNSISSISSHVSGITVGDTASNRTGVSILAKSAHIKGYLQFQSGTTGSRVIMLLVRDEQQVGDTYPIWSDIFSSDINGFINNNSAGRFTILKKQVYEQDSSIAEVTVDMWVGLDHHIRYNGTASTDIQKGGVYLVMISNKAGGVTAPVAALNSRLTFYDN